MDLLVVMLNDACHRCIQQQKIHITNANPLRSCRSQQLVHCVGAMKQAYIVELFRPLLGHCSSGPWGCCQEGCHGRLLPRHLRVAAATASAASFHACCETHVPAQQQPTIMNGSCPRHRGDSAGHIDIGCMDGYLQREYRHCIQQA